MERGIGRVFPFRGSFGRREIFLLSWKVLRLVEGGSLLDFPPA